MKDMRERSQTEPNHPDDNAAANALAFIGLVGLIVLLFLMTH